MRYRRYRRRRRAGRLSLLTGVGLLLAERQLRGRVTGRRMSLRREWPGLARELAWHRFAFYTPTGLALRLGTRLVRRFAHF